MVDTNAQNLEYLCKLIYETFKIPVVLLDSNNKSKVEFITSPIPNSLVAKTEEFLSQVIGMHSTTDIPILKTTNQLENYLIFKIDSNTLVVGPSINSDVKNETLSGLKSDLQLTLDDSILRTYYSSLPITNKSMMLTIGKFIYYALYQKSLDIIDIMKKTSLSDQDIKIENTDLLLSQKRIDQSFHSTLLYERNIFHCVKEGNKEELLKTINTPPDEGELGVLSKKSHLRSEKNLVISGITLGTRAAMEGGLDHELAYTLSDLYIQNLEDIKDITKVNPLFIEAMCDLAERVKRSKQLRYSKAINKCISHIFKNLYEDISLSNLAELVNLSSSYLSLLFKKEVGISLIHYIQQEKIEEAKKLIVLTNYSLSDIYTMLNYHDQSYFTKVFKKITGLTPREYRNLHG